jgi:hypothetical protein
MTISLKKFEEIKTDEENLHKFIEMLEHGYSWLSAQCEHALGGMGDGIEEDGDDEEEVDADMDLPPEDMRRGIIKAKIAALDDFDPNKNRRDDNEYFEEEIEYDPNNPNEPVRKKKEEEQTIAIDEIYRMIKQLSHPDKIMRFSAADKQKIVAIFHESTEFMEDDNLEALVFSYVKLRIFRHEPHKIPDYIESFMRKRHSQILRHMAFLMEKPFTPAILEWRDGNEAWAIILFKRYLKEDARQRELNAQREQSDEEFFAD